MVEILGKNISSEQISDRVRNWQTGQENTVRPEAITALERFMREITIPSLYFEEGNPRIRRTWEAKGPMKDLYSEIMEELNSDERSTVRGAAYTLTGIMVGEAMRGEIK